MPSPNVYKFSDSSTPEALRIGNMSVGISGVNYGPTSQTGFWNGLVISGPVIWVLYTRRNEPENSIYGPSIVVFENDTDFIDNMAAYGSGPLSTLEEALDFVNSQPDLFAVNRNFPEIVSDGLVLCLDAGYTPSYPLGGTGWTDVSGQNHNVTLNGTTYATGGIIFNGTSDYGDLNTLELTAGYTLTFCIELDSLPGDGITDRQTLLGDSSISTKIFNLELAGDSTININRLGSGTSNAYSIPALTTGNKYMLTVVREDDYSISVYVNGTKTDLDVNTSLMPGTVDFNGIAQILNNRFFGGKIYMVLGYNRALALYEVQNNYNSLNSIYSFTSVSSPTFAQGAIDVLRTSAKNNNGTFENESVGVSALSRLENLNLISQASFISTPNAFNESFLYNAVPNYTPYNLVLFSEQFDNSLWTKTRCAVTSNAAIAPDGTLTADFLYCNNTSGLVRLTFTSTLSPTILSQNIGPTYVASFYIKNNNLPANSTIDIGIYNTGQNSGTEVAFNVTTGQKVGSTGITTFTEDVGDGWFRLSVLHTIPVATGFSFFLDLFNVSPVLNQGIYIWGGQVTQSSEVLPYQKTVGPQTSLLPFFRSSTGTYTNSAGKIQIAPYNLLQRSQEFDNAIWNKFSSSTVSPNTTIAPDGTYTADSLIENSSAGLHFTGQTNYVYGQHTFSVYVKKNTRSWVYLTLYDGSVDRYSYFNLDNGTLGSKESSVTASIVDAKNGWYRCIITATGNNQYPSIQLATADGTRSYTGNGTSGLYIWGAQMVQGSEPLDYFTTTTTQAVPRIDYGLGSGAFLIEDQTTNSFLWSENFSNAAWTKSNMTVSSDTTEAPSGINTADTLTADSSNAILKQNGGSVAINNIRCCSFYLKRKTGTGQISIQVGGVSTTASVTSSWSRFTAFGTSVAGTYACTSGAYTVNTTGAHGVQDGESVRFLVTTGSGVTAYVSAVTVTSSTQFTFSNGSATSSGNCTVFPSTGRIVISTSGDEVYAWGASLDVTTGLSQAGNFVYSYIPTLSSIVTRSRDQYSLNPTRDGILTSGVGTWYCEMYHVPKFRFGNGYLSLGTDTYANTIQFNVGISASFRIYKVISSAATVIVQDISEGWKYVIARWDGTNLDIFLNGVKYSGGSYTLTAFTDFSSQQGGGPPIYVRSNVLFPVYLQDATCLQLTTP